MKQRTTLLLLSVIFFLLLCIPLGCGTTAQANNARMVVITNESLGDIVYDRETYVEYWLSRGMYNGGSLTPLYDANGKPLIYSADTGENL